MRRSRACAVAGAGGFCANSVLDQRRTFGVRFCTPMIKEHNQIMVTLIAIADACAIGLAWVISYWIRFHWLPVDTEKGIPSFLSHYLAMMPLVVLSHLGIFALTG